MNLVFNAQSILLSRGVDGSYSLPTTVELAGLQLKVSQIKPDYATLLAHIDIIPSDITHVELVNLRQALNFLSTIAEQLIFTQQMVYYQEHNQFCGKCGHQTLLNTESQWLTCSYCQNDIYPKISPAMIVAVTKGDKLLMAQANHFAPTMWSILAGFSEVGESLEQTVAREVMEEVGIRVKNIRYWGSQYWPFPNSLMVGFVAEYESGEIVLDTSEMRAAGFYERNELPGRPSTNLSIASRIIDAFISGELS